MLVEAVQLVVPIPVMAVVTVVIVVVREVTAALVAALADMRVPEALEESVLPEVQALVAVAAVLVLHVMGTQVLQLVVAVLVYLGKAQMVMAASILTPVQQV
jgi:hypothetical protein